MNATPSRCLLTGLVLGCLLAAPLSTAQAQWTVYDPANHATQIERMIADTARWLETIDKYRKDIEHYAKMFDKAVEQLTTMKGVLKTVDEQLARHKALAAMIGDVGKIVKDSFKLYGQLEALVLHRLAALKRIDDRLRNGIFDVEQDKRDFEQYLKHTMGRSSRDSLATRARVASADRQLGLWLDEQTRIALQIADLHKQLKILDTLLLIELARPAGSRNEVAHINDQIAQLQARIDALVQVRAELTDKINARLAQHGARIQDMENFGRQVVAVNGAWREFAKVRDTIARSMDRLVSGK